MSRLSNKVYSLIAIQTLFICSAFASTGDQATTDKVKTSSKTAFVHYCDTHEGIMTYGGSAACYRAGGRAPEELSNIESICAREVKAGKFSTFGHCVHAKLGHTNLSPLSHSIHADCKRRVEAGEHVGSTQECVQNMGHVLGVQISQEEPIYLDLDTFCGEGGNGFRIYGSVEKCMGAYGPSSSDPTDIINIYLGLTTPDLINKVSQAKDAKEAHLIRSLILERNRREQQATNNRAGTPGEAKAIN